ncbi:MAG TPA: TAT-variant-translocated molybdopterin oxidoreductase, partial [Thermoanaerobaculia bacterium]|nr:TAT-variant-translocated molybdopterin oxidoreductase [Thermoanaerobaculia bacterium]
TPGFEEMLHRELPRFASEWVETGDPEGADGGLSRRRFLQLSSASVALAGLTACTRQPPESIVPYVRQPEDVVPGRPLYFATAFAMGGYAQGILVESHTGRPTKVEGNPEHPANPGGGTDAFAQASILQLYDPDRSGVLDYLGQIRTWQDFQRDLAPRLRALRALGGAGLRILTGTVTSPTLAAQLEALLKALPEARWYQWEPAGRHSVHRGAVRAFGHPVETRYDLSRADVIVALDSDFLTQGPGAVRAAHDWAGRRRAPGPDGATAAVSRLYALESMPSNTGSVADHRLAARPSEIARFALALAADLGVAGAEPVALEGEAGRWLPAVAADLRAHPGRALVVAGDGAPPAVHVLAHAINHALGAVGSTVRYTEPAAARPDDQVAGIRALAEELHAGEVDTLLILGANPAFDAPADLDLAAALPQAGLRVHVGLYKDETSQYCQWHVPQAHFLESWGDARAADGTVSIVQPLIEPLYQGRSFHEVLSQLTDRTDATARELVRERWRDQLADEPAWRRALHDGFVPETALPEVGVSAGGVEEAAADVRVLSTAAGGAVEIAFSPDPAVWDGSWANNAWLQELPRPATRLTWDNAVLMSPATARVLGVAGIGADLVHRRPRVRVTVGERALELPAWVVPGHADGAVTLHFGQGRRRAGKVAEGAGFDLYPLRTSDGLWLARGELAVAGGTYPMATTQDHHSMEGRHLVRTGTLAGYLEDPEIIRRQGHEVPEASFFPEWKYDGYAWGMAVDLNVCTGCSACVIACQSENNIPVVGKEQVARGREMHWLRIDRYFEGPDAEEVSAIHHQPVLCMQCEKAPCEVVCPVAATVHSSEGLNDMVYNRCVGTRYCSNNCPYKVRRFNFLKYTDHETEVLKLGRNPDVTVRQRGVMEKCTYCVQRINHARIEAKVAGQRNPSDGGGEGTIPRDSIKTACQQACPSGALVFGDINDPDSEVSRRKAEPLGYALLEELGTKPRTTYLAKLRNPNPALEPHAAATGSRHGGH